MNKTIISLVLLAMANISVAACRNDVGSVAPDSRYQLQNHATEVLDTATGLVWQRCSLGQSYNLATGACDNPVSTFSWTQAVEQATGLWRLPNLKELSSLVARECETPAINTYFFPDTPSAWYWSSSPYPVGTHIDYKAWAVDFSDGFDGLEDKDSVCSVRLVRASQ